ncbi:IclR family transcriptional regulator [Schumannella luteola]|uniref:DNA-binding IclR family transcriptional regulator n=1 Tax=Schumannella luteola TaxID=472059 RepID=A0A852YS82_9MICO|nr:IclR family transcriptional regulator [Schumannella luteola]NYH00570.1 DNA-binding IclR family transcriptional regulator [Schumannella luteola]TPX04965.1 IclR family transcriptional regulator [Schumannella luteola]
MPATSRTADAATRTPPRRNAAGLRRDLELLEVLASDEARAAPAGLGVVRVAELVGRDKGQVSRTLATLADAGLVRRDADSLGYTLGHRLYSLAAQTAEARLVRDAAPYLRRVVGATHETTHLCVLRGGSVLTLSSELSEHNYRGLGWEGVSTAAWRTSSGRVLVSEYGDDELAQWFAEHGADEPIVDRPPRSLGAEVPAPRPDPGKLIVTDEASLLAEIGRVRQTGYAKVDEEFEVGVVGVSAPVRDFRGTIVAALNISAPKSRLGRHLDEAGRLTAKVADELSRALGRP